MSPHWTLNHRIDSTTRPWLVLQTKAHVNDVSDLSDAEAGELGRVLPSVTGAIKRVTGAERVYVGYFNELAHVHFHLIPRFRSESAPGAAVFSDHPGSPGVVMTDDQVLEVAQASSIDPGHEPHAVVRGVVAACRWFDEHLSLYGRARRAFWREPRASAAFAPVYVAMWAFALTLALAFQAAVAPPAIVGTVLAGLGLFRWLDILLYEGRILLDRRSDWLSGFERSVLLAAANLYELGVIGAIWLLVLEGGRDLGPTWLHTFSLTTLSGTPEYTGVLAALAQGLTLVGGLTLIGGTIALLVGSLGGRMREGR